MVVVFSVKLIHLPNKMYSKRIMPTRAILFSLLLTLLPLSLYSQVRGVILDAKTRISIQSASVRAYNKDSAMIDGVISDEDGRFVIKAKHVIRLHISYVGYEDRVLENPDGLTGDMGEVLMNEAVMNLETVSVTVALRRTGATKETIMITDSLRKGAISSARLLDKIPGIRTDWITEAVKIGHEGNVPVVVNGQEVEPQYAMSINPKRIKKVEIIRYPTGKYADYPVIVNLELFEDYVGWDIAPRLTAMSSLRHKYTNRENVAGNVTWSMNRWNLYGSAEYGHRHLYDVSAFEKRYGDLYAEQTADIDLYDPNMRSRRHSGMINMGVDYRLTPLHIVSLQTRVDLDKYKEQDDHLLFTGIPGTPSQKFRLSGNSYEAQSSAVRASYKGTISAKMNLTADLLYNHYHVDEERIYRLGEDYLSEKAYRGRKDYFAQSINMAYGVSSKWKLLLDNTFTWRRYVNREKTAHDFSFQSEDLRNRFNAGFEYSSGRRFELSAGSSLLTIRNSERGENRTVSSFIPYLKLYWQPIDFIGLRLDYFNSVDYPTLDQLSTTQWQVDPYMIHKGNPDLKARIMHYAEAQLQLGRLFKLTYMHKISDDDITLFYERMPDGLFVETLTNCKYRHAYLSIEGDYTPAKGLNLTALANYQWYTRYKTPDDKRYGYTYTFDTQLVYALPKAKMNLVSNYYLRYDWLPLLQGREYFQEELLGCGVNRMFFDNKCSATLMFGLPTNLISKRTFREIDIEGYRSVTYGDGRMNSFIVSLNVRYSLGNGKARRYSSETQIEQEKQK